MLAKLGFVLLAIGSGLSPGATIISSIEGGSLGKVTKIASNHFRLAVVGETDQAGRNRQASWYYFRVEGAPGTEMIFDIVDLENTTSSPTKARSRIRRHRSSARSQDLDASDRCFLRCQRTETDTAHRSEIIKVLDRSHASVHRR